MVSYDDWAAAIEARVQKLNVSSASRIFEVGPSQTLIVFEIGGFMGSDQMKELIDGAQPAEPEYYGVIHNVNPGIWAVSKGCGNLKEDPPFTATWVSDGRIDDYEALPQTPLVSPLNLDAVEWNQVHHLSFNSTVGCVLAYEIAREFEEVGMEDVVSTFEDLGGVVPGGFIFGPHESAQELDVRVQNGRVVQMRVNWRELEPVS